MKDRKAEVARVRVEDNEVEAPSLRESKWLVLDKAKLFIKRWRLWDSIVRNNDILSVTAVIDVYPKGYAAEQSPCFVGTCTVEKTRYVGKTLIKNG